MDLSAVHAVTAGRKHIRNQRTLKADASRWCVHTSEPSNDGFRRALERGGGNNEGEGVNIVKESCESRSGTRV